MSQNSIHFSMSTDQLAKHETDCLIIGVCEDTLTNEAKTLDSHLKGYLQSLLDSGDISGKLGSLLPLYNLSGINAKRLLIVGLGQEKKSTFSTLNKAALAATNWLKTSSCTTATFALLDQCKQKECSIPILLQGIADSLYYFDDYKSEKKAPNKLTTISLLDKDASETTTQAFTYGLALIKGMNLTKNLGNTPANHLTPEGLANSAKILAEEFSSIQCHILEQKELETLGMGALLGVAQGSEQPPKLIVLEYNHSQANQAPVALVGKGVTFDSGGISLKPGANMDEMKFDMCGAASVLGTFRALAELKMNINIVGIIPAVENMPSGKAIKPGDVVTTMSGKTVEVLNTDAEGRLILCDALTYAITHYKPKIIVDIATLTGAIIVALGHSVSGLFSNNEKLAKELSESGQDANDLIWQFPIWEDVFQPMLDSNFADMGNISAGRDAGSITAACFLERFVQEYPWAHLDIAGTAWTSGKEKGATARPVPLLLNFIKKYAD